MHATVVIVIVKSLAEINSYAAYTDEWATWESGKQKALRFDWPV